MIIDRRVDPRYRVGQRVRHRRYGYRGVIVELDLSCQADEAWYQNNRTQPDRDQPWYHVLVHGGAHATYAAESSLEPDPGEEVVRHPLLERFFERFENGAYIRNKEPWVGM